MTAYPQRKRNRLAGYDYAMPGCYFITICAQDHKWLFWNRLREKRSRVGANCVRPQAPLPLSRIGCLVEAEIQTLDQVYPNVRVDKYCIMPDHLHMLLFITCDFGDSAQVAPAPTLSRIVKQFKGALTKQIGFSPWQKSFYDKIIDSEAGYLEAWQYIDENPLKYALKKRRFISRRIPALKTCSAGEHSSPLHGKPKPPSKQAAKILK